MLISWAEKFNSAKGRTKLTGWAFDSEADCKDYFASRVKSKIQQSDTTVLLEEYLVEMTDTGFDTSALQAQVQSPPRAKDWEVGEAFAQVMLEDRFDASFPWPTSWDKRARNASLPGPDMPGFHRRKCPRFLFGEVKSSSEEKTPPKVAKNGDDSLCKQVIRLLTSAPHRQQLVEWLLVRTRESRQWRPIFDEAIKCYANDDACICGILVRGGTPPTVNDLSSVQGDLETVADKFDVLLIAFYLPFEKSQWVDLVYGKGLQQ